MPQSQDTPEVSFTIPVQNDSASALAYRTVHVIVPKINRVSDAEIVIRPLLFIVPVAAILILVLMRIKDTKKTDKILHILENITGKFIKDKAKR